MTDSISSGPTRMIVKHANIFELQGSGDRTSTRYSCASIVCVRIVELFERLVQPELLATRVDHWKKQECVDETGESG